MIVFLISEITGKWYVREAYHAKAKISLVQHFAAILATAELLLNSDWSEVFIFFPNDDRLVLS